LADALKWGVAVEFLEFVFDLDFEIRGLDIDGFGGFTDYAANTIKHLSSGLQLTFFESLIEELGAHVLETREHIFAVTLPVFIAPGLNSFPINPSSAL
jgi:hypothetical protein